MANRFDERRFQFKLCRKLAHHSPEYNHRSNICTTTGRNLHAIRFLLQLPSASIHEIGREWLITIYNKS